MTADKQEQINNGGDLHQCHLLKEACSGKCNFRKRKLSHLLEQHSDSASKLYFCDICNTSFTALHYLNNHRRMHTGEGLHQSDVCQKIFTAPALLERHKTSHTRDWSFECYICGKGFHHAYQLANHRKKPCRGIHEKWVNPNYGLSCLPYTCGICDNSYSTESDLTEHMNVHARSHRTLCTGNKPYECIICGKRFRLLHELNNHKMMLCGCVPAKRVIHNHSWSLPTTLGNIHTEGKGYKCDSCNNSYSTESGLMEHMKFHSGSSSEQCDRDVRVTCRTDEEFRSKQYVCAICSNRFSSKSYLDIHKRIHTGDYRYQCEVCKKKFTNPYVLKAHRKIHIGKKLYKCNICDKAFNLLYKLKIHKKRPCRCIPSEVVDHNYSLTPPTRFGSNDIEENRFKCDICNNSYSTESSLKEHLKIHAGSTSFQSDSEGRLTCQEDEELLVQEIHVDTKSYMCQTCNQYFSDISSFKKHKLTHAEGRSYPSSVELSIDESDSFDIPRNLAFEENVCDICNKKLSSRFNLASHKRIHSGDSQYQCEVCNKKFTTPNGLKFHRILHICHKPFECNICGKAFRRLHTLTKHKKKQCKRIDEQGSNYNHGLLSRSISQDIDSTEMPSDSASQDIDSTEMPSDLASKDYVCDICNKKLSSQFNLDNHKKIHSGDLHQCDVCMTNFTSEFILEYHRWLHTGNKPHECKNCSKRFSFLYELNNHKKIQSRCVPSDQIINNQSCFVPTSLQHIDPEEKPYKCGICRKSYSNESGLKEHMTIHAGCTSVQTDTGCRVTCQTDEELVPQVVHAVTDSYLCDTCGQVFSDVSIFREHQLTHAEGRIYSSNAEPNSDESHSSETSTSVMSKKFVCDICDKELCSIFSLNNHKRIHSGEKLHQCDVCMRKFTTPYVLKRHQMLHKRDKMYKCNMCDKEFSNIYNFENHKQEQCRRIHEKGVNPNYRLSPLSSSQDIDSTERPTDSASKDYVCGICNKKLRSQFNLDNHKRIHSGDLHQCELCKKKFSTRYALKRHRNLHTGNKPHECDICNERFSFLYELKNHKKSQYRCIPANQIINNQSCSVPTNFEATNTEEKQCTSTVEQHFECDICKKSYSTESALKEHMNIHAGSASVQTDTGCRVTCQTDDEFVPQEVHAVTESYLCDTYGQYFSDVSSFREHQLTHTEGRFYSSNVEPNPDESNSSETSTNVVSKKFVCDICDKYLCSKLSLNNHKRIHTGEYLHQCTVCKKKFTNPYILKRHQMLHKRDKMYKCNMCSKEFNNLYNFKNHKQEQCKRIQEKGVNPKHGLSPLSTSQEIDSTERPTDSASNEYVCNICNKKLSSQVNLDNHKRIHSGDLHQCDFCKRKFTSKYLLKYHRTLHTGKKPYECNICGKEFSLLHLLNNHKKAKCGFVEGEGDTSSFGLSPPSTSKEHGTTDTWEQPYQCDVCNMTFSHLYEMANHKRKHGVCVLDVCNGTYMNSAVADAVQYTCDFCSNKFETLPELTVHIRAHVTD